MTAKPIGTFTKNTPRQLQYATKSPPKIGPIIAPIENTLPNRLTARSRALPK